MPVLSHAPSNRMKPPVGTPLDRPHPLRVGLAAAYLLNDGGSNARFGNATKGATDLLQGAAGYYGGAPGMTGPCVRFDGTGYLAATNPLAATAPFTIATCFRLTTINSGGTQQGIVSIGAVANESEPLYLLANNDASTLRVILGDVAYVNVLTAPVLKVWYTVVSTITAASAGTESHYLGVAGGSAIQVATNSRTYGTVKTTNLYLASGFNAAKDCDIKFCCLWNRALTYGEALDFIRAPYQVWSKWAYTPIAPPTGIQFDAVSNSGYQAAQSTYSWSHTCSGSNRFLSVDVALLSAGATVTGITYNSVALSLIRARSTVTSFGRVECWGLANPTSGSNTIAVTLSSSIASSSEAVSYTGVHQTTPTEGAADNQATNVGAADATVDVTSTADQCWIHAALATSDGDVTASQTARNEVNGAGGSGADEDFGPQSPATKTMGYTDVGALATWAIAGYAVRPVTAGGNSYSVTAADASSVSDSVTRLFVGSRTLTDAPLDSSTVTRLFVGSRTLSDAPSATSPVTRLYVGLRTLSDSPSTSDAVTRATSQPRTASDAPSTAETVSRLFAGVRSIADAPSTADVAARTVSYPRTATDSPSVVDSITRLFVGARATGDSPSTTDDMSAIKGRVVAVTDSPSVSSTVTRLLVGARTLSDTISVSDSTTRIFVGARTASDAPFTSSVVTGSTVPIVIVIVTISLTGIIQTVIEATGSAQRNTAVTGAAQRNVGLSADAGANS